MTSPWAALSTGNLVGNAQGKPTRLARIWLQKYAQCLLIAGLSVLAIIPCIWQPHIHTLDLPSHTYNAWLAQVVQRQPVPGIIVDSPWTNVLFDLLLAGIAQVTGFLAAETIAAIVAVLVFFWGTFALLARINGSVNWACVPLLLVLTYGLTFRFGFFNFYLATGLSAAALATLKLGSSSRLIVALLLTLASLCANPLPVLYAIGAASCVAILRRLRPHSRVMLLSAAALAIISFGQILSEMFPTSTWSPYRLFSLPGLLTLAGLDQLWIYSDQYFVLGLASLLIVIAGILPALRSLEGSSYLIICLLALNVVLMNGLPSAILFPAHKLPLAFLPERISLFSAILVCSLIGRLPTRHWIHRLLAIVCVAFFALTWRDDAVLAQFSSQLEEGVSIVPEGARVIASISDPQARLDPLLHLIDRACLGRCFSYGNYEPVSGHFRVQATGHNNLVLAVADHVKQVEAGSFTVRAADEPVYTICRCTDSLDKLCAQRLTAGERMCSVRVSVVGN
jgi:hypothetical protein